MSVIGTRSSPGGREVEGASPSPHETTAPSRPKPTSRAAETDILVCMVDLQYRVTNQAVHEPKLGSRAGLAAAHPTLTSSQATIRPRSDAQRSRRPNRNRGREPASLVHPPNLTSSQATIRPRSDAQRSKGPKSIGVASRQSRLSAPDTIRTYDLGFRKALLYPAELRGLETRGRWHATASRSRKARAAIAKTASAVPTRTLITNFPMPYGATAPGRSSTS